MRGWLRFARGVDALNEWVGRVAAWCVLLMVALGAYNAVARYLGRSIGMRLSSNAFLEMQWYLFSVVFLLGAAYALKHNAHVRVDLLYGRVSSRVQAWIDLLGAALFLIPFSALGIVLAWPAVRNSWAVRETSPDPGGLARYPIKALILAAFALLILQGLAEIVKQIAILRGAVTPDHEVPQARQEGM